MRMKRQKGYKNGNNHTNSLYINGIFNNERKKTEENIHLYFGVTFETVLPLGFILCVCVAYFLFAVLFSAVQCFIFRRISISFHAREVYWTKSHHTDTMTYYAVLQSNHTCWSERDRAKHLSHILWDIKFAKCRCQKRNHN